MSDLAINRVSPAIRGFGNIIEDKSLQDAVVHKVWTVQGGERRQDKPTSPFSAMINHGSNPFSLSINLEMPLHQRVTESAIAEAVSAKPVGIHEVRSMMSAEGVRGLYDVEATCEEIQARITKKPLTECTVREKDGLRKELELFKSHLEWLNENFGKIEVKNDQVKVVIKRLNEKVALTLLNVRKLLQAIEVDFNPLLSRKV